jgi:hypothetical protein
MGMRVRVKARMLPLDGLDSTALFIDFLSRFKMVCLRPVRTFHVGPLLHQGLAETAMVSATPCRTPWSLSVESCRSAGMGRGKWSWVEYGWLMGVTVALDIISSRECNDAHPEK